MKLKSKTERCIHHAAKPLKLGDLHDGNQKYITDEEAKPDGLWFSVGDGADWIALVKARFKPHQIRYQTEVFFVENANILRIEDANGIDALTAEYGRTRASGRQAIDWTRVASRFAGIIIAPHYEERANHKGAQWYGCWEVSCGCVWSASAVKHLRPLNY
jgi:hypothetical protein